MKNTKPKKPTKWQREIAEMFKRGMSIKAILLEHTEWPINQGACMDKVQDAIRSVLIWESMK